MKPRNASIRGANINSRRFLAWRPRGSLHVLLTVALNSDCCVARFVRWVRAVPPSDRAAGAASVLALSGEGRLHHHLFEGQKRFQKHRLLCRDNLREENACTRRCVVHDICCCKQGSDGCCWYRTVRLECFRLLRHTELSSISPTWLGFTSISPWLHSSASLSAQAADCDEDRAYKTRNPQK